MYLWLITRPTNETFRSWVDVKQVPACLAEIYNIAWMNVMCLRTGGIELDETLWSDVTFEALPFWD